VELPVLIRRLWFDALDDVRFPDGKATNVLRGGFGASLKAIAPPATYERIFEPKSFGEGPSGLGDPPRPFVFRGAHLDGRLIAKHDDFHFDIHVFGDPLIAEIITDALTHLFQNGAGVGRGRARLTALTNQQIQASLAPGEPAGRAKVTFITPTELKHQGRLVVQPEFPILIRRVRDRVATLMSLYGPGEPDLDFRAFGHAADLVQTIRSDIDQRETGRTSSRTGQTHPIGGLVGEAEYAGPLDAFIPFLRAAYYTGVGRHTVWGNGCIETEILSRFKPSAG
jgi:CRISPR-associated endoribonuclease Cas6